MGILNRIMGTREKSKVLEEEYEKLKKMKNKMARDFIELLSDPDIEVRKDCSQYLLNVVLPVVKSQKESYERDNAIEKLTVIAKEMRAPLDEHEKMALNSAVFYFILDMMKKGTFPEG
ncbi:MAG: hypothetical protein U5L07_00770 [Desulfobacterales bacterium]|nr:hypothetical protein [Desulfobacterales bacterium]